MGKSLKIGSIAGIKLQLHWTFSLIVVWVLATSLLAGKGLLGSLSSIAFILVLFGCVLLHELGHALAARMYGIPTRDITLIPIGGVARLERLPRQPLQELVVALAGPAVNVVIAAMLFLLLAPTVGLASILTIPLQTASFLQQLMSSMSHWWFSTCFRLSPWMAVASSVPCWQYSRATCEQLEWQP